MIGDRLGEHAVCAALHINEPCRTTQREAGLALLGRAAGARARSDPSDFERVPRAGDVTVSAMLDRASMLSDEAAVSSSTDWPRPLRWSVPSMSVGSGGAEPGGAYDYFALPTGTVTFLLTDVEGSTLGWEAGPTLMGAAIDRHYEILDDAVARNGGVRPQEQGEGDSIVAAFGRASDAVKAALDAQVALQLEPWSVELRTPIRVRMAIHTGEAQMRNEANYVGQAIIRTARLRTIAHGGQVLVSQAARDLAIDQLGAQVDLLDLGSHRLKDLARPEHVWQLVAPELPSEFPPLKSLDAVPNNLPLDLSTFIGREAEISTVAALVAGNRLVTISGAGGAGKTRLAQQVAAQLSDRFEDGTWWVELAPVDREAVITLIASAVSVREAAQLAERLAGRTLLLVLDNCEHVLDIVSPLVREILAKAPNVRVLATSRGALDVPGEVSWRVPALGLPVDGEAVSVDRLAQYDAVRLFVDRAQRARPNFSLNNENGAAVAGICAGLDGIPLAIELAAARAKSLTPDEILVGLEDSLRLLTGGSRVAMPRQQTLEGSIAWSHALLAPPDRILLRRLSVFAGGWALDAAEEVCADELLRRMDVLDGLERLIDQSLVRVEDDGRHTRYGLLETVRQYADRRLVEAGERDRFISAHTEWFRDLALIVAPLVEGPDEQPHVDRLVSERDNIAAALRRLRIDSPEVFVDVVLAMCIFWNHTKRVGPDTLAWTDQALAVVGDEPTVMRVRLLAARGEVLSWMGRFMDVFTELNIAIAAGEALGERAAAGRSRGMLALFTSAFDLPTAEALIARAIEDARFAGDVYGELKAMQLRGLVLYVFPADAVRARPALDEAEHLLRQYGNVGLLADWHQTDSNVRIGMGDNDGARRSVAVYLATATGPLAEMTELISRTIVSSNVGEPGPSVELIAARQAFAERTLDLVNAGMLMVALVIALRGRDELPAALVESDRGVARAKAQIASNVTITGVVLFSCHGAQVALALGDMEGARQRFANVGDVSALGFDKKVLKYQTAALLARADGDLVTADAQIRSALQISTTQFRIVDLVTLVEMLAGLDAAQGSWLDAARLFGAAQQQRDDRRLHGCFEPFRTQRATDMAAARAALGDHRFDEAYMAGRALSLDDTLAFVERGRGERGRPTIGWSSLTPTERRVADLARLGKTNSDIAAELLMGGETVKTHLSRIYAKLDVPNRTRLAALTAPPTAGVS